MAAITARTRRDEEGRKDSGVYKIFSVEDLLVMPVEVSFEGVSTRPRELKDALEDVISAYSEGDNASYTHNRQVCEDIIFEGMIHLQDFAKHLVDRHMTAYEQWDTSCAGMGGFTYRNCSQPRDPQELEALLGRVKSVPRLAKKYLEKQKLDREAAKSILNFAANWKYDRIRSRLVYTMPDLNALRAKFKDRDNAMRFIDALEKDERVIILNVESHNKPPRKEGVPGYKGIHVQALYDSDRGDPKQIELQLHPRDVFKAAQMDDYHKESRRCLEPPRMVECLYTG